MHLLEQIKIACRFEMLAPVCSSWIWINRYTSGRRAKLSDKRCVCVFLNISNTRRAKYLTNMRQAVPLGEYPMRVCLRRQRDDRALHLQGVGPLMVGGLVPAGTAH
jgi:hypothetical protein